MMQPVDNSDLSWLVVADWLDDNVLPGGADLRTMIVSPSVSAWSYEYRSRVVGGVGVGGAVGGGGGGVVGAAGGGAVGGGGGGVVGAAGGGAVGVGG